METREKYPQDTAEKPGWTHSDIWISEPTGGDSLCQPRPCDPWHHPTAATVGTSSSCWTVDIWSTPLITCCNWWRGVSRSEQEEPSYNELQLPVSTCLIRAALFHVELSSLRASVVVQWGLWRLAPLTSSAWILSYEILKLKKKKVTTPPCGSGSRGLHAERFHRFL